LDTEFELYEDDTRVRLEMKLQQGWDLVESTVAALTPDELTSTVFIRGQAHSVLEAVNRQLTHYAYHVGQIVYMARATCGQRWEALSIPSGHSESFNARLGR